MKQSPSKPTHIHLDVNDKRTACGIRINKPEALPFVLAEHVDAHVAGYGMLVCEACASR